MSTQSRAAARCAAMVLSALGALPLPNQELERDISPTRIADPLLWLLWANGFIGEAVRR